MLRNLEIHNFKAWRTMKSLRFAPITGVFGTNSSGKSSLLHLLLLLKQTVNSTDRGQVLMLGDEKTPVNLGTYRDLVFRHNTSEDLFFRFEWTENQSLKVKNPSDPRKTLIESDQMAFQCAINGHGKVLDVLKMAYELDGHRFTLSRTSAAGDKYKLSASGGEFTFHRTVGRAWPLPRPAKFYGFPDQVRAYFKNADFLSDLELALENRFHRTYYLGPLREHPRRDYRWAGTQPEDVGSRGERVVEAILASRDRGESISMGKRNPRRTLEEHVAHWLRDLGLVHSFSVTPISEDSGLYTVKVRKSPDGPEALLTDVGFGVSQILPVLTLCYYVPEGSTIIFEQPEIHLHPSVQSGLADVFLDAIERRKVQIVFESHSEHLLRRLQRRIAEKVSAPDQVALYFCDQQDGESSLSALQIDEYGMIRNWPKDFFGDDFGEMAAITTATVNRKRKQAG